MCLWELYRQLWAVHKPGPTYGLRQPNDVIVDTMCKAVCVINQIDDAAIVADKLSARSENKIDNMERIEIAIAKHGKAAKPDVIIKEAQINRQSGRQLLRKLEDEGKYSGFARDLADRYKSTTQKRFSVPER